MHVVKPLLFTPIDTYSLRAMILFPVVKQVIKPFYHYLWYYFNM